MRGLNKYVMKIIHREQTELNPAERKVLTKARRKKFMGMLIAYLALIAILVIICMTALVKSSEISIEKTQSYQRGTYIFTGLSFILFTGIFIIHYFRAIYPYTQDLKRGLKTVSWFYPASYKTPFFDSFFLKTGSRKKPMLSIPKNLYEAIQPGVLAYIVFAPESHFVLLLDINGKQVEFNEENNDFEL